MANIFHHSLKLGNFTSIEVSTKNTDTIVGENCVFDDFVKIKHVGGSGNIIIGNYVYLNSGCVLYSGNGIKIGNNVLVGPNCNIVPVNHNFDSKEIPIRLQGFKPSKGGIVIEDDVWLGAGVTVLDGAIIKKGCIIAANSVVSGVLEPFSVYGGNPIRLIKAR